jgi:DNA-binding response OmpR family regulator
MSHGSKTVLLVSDHPMMLEYYESQLKNAGFLVLSKSNAIDAMRAARDARPDILVSDLRLLETLCAEVRGDQDTEDLPIVLYTASDLSPQDRSRIFAITKAEVIVLPTQDTAALLQRVRAILDAEKERTPCQR